MKVRFPKLHKWQKDVFDTVTNDNGRGGTYCVKARRQCGKSVVAIAILLYFAFKQRSIGVMLEPTLKQSRRVWKQTLNALGGYGSPAVKSANSTLLTIELHNGSEINFCSAEQGDNLRGQTVKHSCLIIDEAAFVDEDIFQIMQPLVDVTNSPVLYISTPLFKDGEFYRRWKMGEEGDKYTKIFDWSLYDTSALLSDEKLEYYRQTMPPLKFRSEYLAQWIDEGSFVFGNIHKCVKDWSPNQAVYAGVDWSQGDDGDYTVIVYLDALNAIVDIKSWKDFDSVDLIDEMAADINARPSLKKIVVEKNSMGKVYYDMLKKKVRNKAIVREFNTTSDSKREIIENLITAFQTEKITIPNDAELITELQHFVIEQTPTGKYRYQSIRRYHDDYVMALAIALSNTPIVKVENKIRIRLV